MQRKTSNLKFVFFCREVVREEKCLSEVSGTTKKQTRSSDNVPLKSKIRIILLINHMKFNFTNRVIPVWNTCSLPNYVVSADTINPFKKPPR